MVSFPIIAPADGEILSASWTADITEVANSVGGVSWLDCSNMALQGSSSNPTLGDSVQAANYRYFAGSDFVVLKYKLTIGSTFSAGSGNYTWVAPVACVADGATGVGSSHVLDNGQGFYPGDVRFVTTTTIEVHPMAAPTASAIRNAPLGSAGPGTAWANGDQIEFTITYRAA